MQIAKTIANQIGRRAFYMMGAKHLTGGEDSLSFKVMRNAAGVTHVVVTLDAMDLYRVEFIRCNVRAKDARKVLSTAEGIYFDQLRVAISDGTGLATSLGAVA